MIAKDKQAAQLMIGMKLPGEWIVVKKIENNISRSSGAYSCCYEVNNGSRKGFLKAFDYSAADKVSNSVESMSEILNAFLFEKEILEKCLENNCKNVIELLETGSVDIEVAEKYPKVQYLILEYAEKGDIRDVLKEDKVTLEWKIRSLHQLAKGLNELHRLSIAHQDVKPSNIVTLNTGKTKLTDLGSAMAFRNFRTNIPKHLEKGYCGSWEYAPPELLYGELSSDPIIRRIGCDLYLLGSMVAFYFTNMSMTSLIKQNLDDSLCWTNHTHNGNYKAVLTYVTNAFEQALTDIEREIKENDLKDKILDCIKFLCHPDPLMRGHKKSIQQRGSNYSLERFVSSFDYLARKIELRK